MGEAVNLTRTEADMSDDTPTPDTDAEQPAAAAPVQVKRPRELVILFSVLSLVVLFSLGGIAYAVFAHKEDPAKITVPVYPQAEVIQEAPPEPVVVEPTTPETVPELPIEPEPAQTESPINLNAPVKAAPVKKSAPQSTIEWDRLPTMTGRPKIAIVIDDMGLNRVNSRRMVALSHALTLAYLPYAEQLPDQTAQARARGHELIVHVPMEPDNVKQNNPGPNALLTTNTPEENLARLEKDLSRFEGYIGLNNHMGSQFTSNETALRPVLERMKQKGLWFLDSRTIGNSVGGKIAREIGLPYATRDVFLDNVESVAAVTMQLKAAEAVARKRGFAIAIGHPHNATIAALDAWLQTIEQRGFELVPLSAVIAARYPNANVPRYAQIPHEATIAPAAGVALTDSNTSSN